MKISTVAVLILIAMAVCIAIAFALGAPEGAGGVAHPTIGNMSIGGPGEARHARVFGVAWAFGACMILLFSTCLALGASKGGKVGGIKIYLFVGVALHLAAFSAVMMAYRPYMVDGTAPFVGSFPLPSAIMLYALWGAPVYFVLLYVIGFKRFIFSEEDEVKFAAIVKASRARENEGTD